MPRNCCSMESVWEKAHKREGCAHSNLAFILSDICITVFFKIQAVYRYNYFCLSCTLCSFTISTTALFVIWGFKQQKNPNNKKNIKSIWHREPVDNNLGITISLKLACYLALPFKNAILLKWVKLHGLYSSQKCCIKTFFLDSCTIIYQICFITEYYILSSCSLGKEINADSRTSLISEGMQQQVLKFSNCENPWKQVESFWLDL